MVLLVLSSSCSGDAEKQRLAEIQKAREDSICVAVENETRLRLERKNALQDSIKSGELMLTGIRNRLMLVRGDPHGYNEQNLKLKTEVDEVELDVDKAIPLGLIVNELISNAFKHAFGNRKDAELIMEVKKARK